MRKKNLILIREMTPSESEDGGIHLDIVYSIFKNKFGICLVAGTRKGICDVLFDDDSNRALQELRNRWPHAKLTRVDGKVFKVVKNHLENKSKVEMIKLHIKGTPFQLNVWRELLLIPNGKTKTYGEIAISIGKKQAARVVGTAIGNNPVGFIIPCHRVIKSNGALGGFRWGVKMKEAMLREEAI